MDDRRLNPVELDVLGRVIADDAMIAARGWEGTRAMAYRSREKIEYVRSMRDYAGGGWIPYAARRWQYAGSAAARQRLCRAVRRLEILGLLDCANLKSDAPRVSHVRLTDFGRQVAEQLGRGERNIMIPTFR